MNEGKSEFYNKAEEALIVKGYKYHHGGSNILGLVEGSMALVKKNTPNMVFKRPPWNA